MMNSSYRAFLIGGLFLVMFLLLPPTASAQEGGASDDEVNEVARDLYCPVCESTPLDVCATQACADWRELIRTKLGEGQSKEEIFEYFARQYGDGVLANPPRRGVSLVFLWILPVVLLLGGALIFSRTMRGLHSEAVAVSSAGAANGQENGSVLPLSGAPPPADDDYIARIEEELGRN